VRLTEISPPRLNPHEEIRHYPVLAYGFEDSAVSSFLADAALATSVVALGHDVFRRDKSSDSTEGVPMPALLATYPTFWDVVWWMIIFSFWVIWIYIVIRVFIDNFARRDHGGGAKAMWTILIIFLPVIGVCSYLIARPSDEVVV
jgi:hypothetical protein